MFPRNNNITENEILQNQFTAYVSLAIRRQMRTPPRNDSRTDEVRHLDR